jgi:3-deoxy-manno-octulosonate cytidylyltransferase (CMP-KDO synthetase)
MKTIAIIPSRYDSSRFPGKPLADLGGKPMIQWVYEQVSRVFSTVFVATDDRRIFDAVQGFHGKALMTAKTHQSGTDRCAEAVKLAEKQTYTEFDVVVNVQGDEPFIQPSQLELIKNCFRDSTIQIATLIRPAGSYEEMADPNKPKVVLNTNNEALLFSRSIIPFIRGVDPKRWLLHHPYYIHIGLYGFRKEVLLEITKLKTSPLEQAESLEQLRWMENNYHIKALLTQHESFGIDTPEDLIRAKFMMQYKEGS